MKETVSSKMYYVLNEAISEVSAAPSEKREMILERLVAQGKAVKAPQQELSQGKILFQSYLILQFLRRYNHDKNYRRYVLDAG
ncbi:hypothetical protein [Paenibacillus campinasensis]|uniref:Uncharacterized protein n=1 Tax=Paenibacillus campinasensis TaxID=66347 RepID=A0A268EIX6_9BACL|nr:hypothetical protein [Paenibacillus campinasensis]PAD73071.1 hypothetical protein CHH67_21060 [Paenibacillus campinasensis]